MVGFVPRLYPSDVYRLGLYLLARKINMHHRTSTDSIRQSMCDICFVSLGQKITCIIAHRPIRFATRCAISGFVSLGQKNHNMHRRTSTDSIRRSMCDVGVCIYWLEKLQHACFERMNAARVCRQNRALILAKSIATTRVTFPCV